MPNAYLVMENEFMYNDEYNELLTLEGTCSNPKRIFWTRAEAEAQALKITKKNMIGEPLSMWSFELEDISSLPEEIFFKQLGAVLGSQFANPDAYYEQSIPSTLDDIQFKQLLAICDKLKIAVIVETQITNESLFQEAAQTLKTKKRAEQSKLEQITQLFGLPYEPVEMDY